MQRLSPIAAIATATTMIPVLSERPSNCKANGKRDDSERRQQQRPVFCGC